MGLGFPSSILGKSRLRTCLERPARTSCIRVCFRTSSEEIGLLQNHVNILQDIIYLPRPFPRIFNYRGTKRKTAFSPVIPLALSAGLCAGLARCNERNLKTARKASGLSTGERTGWLTDFQFDFPTMGLKGSGKISLSLCLIRNSA